jgi:hypothetical protein
MKSEDIINWPSDVPFREIYRMNTNDLKKLHKLVKADGLDYSPEFLSKLKSISHHQLKSDVRKYLMHKFTQKLNRPSISIPWSRLEAGDIINWPSDVTFKPVNQLKTKELKRLLKMAKKDVLDFSPEFLNQFNSGMGDLSRDKLRNDITQYLLNKLVNKLGRSRKQIPWSLMKAAHIINWPPDINFAPPYKMNMNEVKRLHQLVKENLLDFTPDFLQELRANHN